MDGRDGVRVGKGLLECTMKYFGETMMKGTDKR